MNRLKSIKMKVGQKTSDSRLPKPPKPPEKPLMPYMRYSRKVWESVKNSNPHLKLWEVGKIIGQMWRELPDNEKSHFVEEYETDKVQYNDALRLYHNSPAYKSWLSHKERMEKSIDESESVEGNFQNQCNKPKDRFPKDSHIVETRESYILEDNDEDPDEVYTVKHVASQRYQRNHKLMLELFSDSKLPELGIVVTEVRLNALSQQVDGLINHKRKLDEEIDEFQKSHEAKKSKIKNESEKFWNEYKKELEARPVITEKMFTDMVKKARDDIIREEREREEAIKQKTFANDMKLAALSQSSTTGGSTDSRLKVSHLSSGPKTESSEMAPASQQESGTLYGQHSATGGPAAPALISSQTYTSTSQQHNRPLSMPDQDQDSKQSHLKNLVDFSANNTEINPGMKQLSKECGGGSSSYGLKSLSESSPCPSNISSSSKAPVLSPAETDPEILLSAAGASQQQHQAAAAAPPGAMQSPNKRVSATTSSTSSSTNSSAGGGGSKKPRNKASKAGKSAGSNSVELESVSSGGQRTPDSLGGTGSGGMIQQQPQQHLASSSSSSSSMTLPASSQAPLMHPSQDQMMSNYASQMQHMQHQQQQHQQQQSSMPSHPMQQQQPPQSMYPYHYYQQQFMPHMRAPSGPYGAYQPGPYGQAAGYYGQVPQAPYRPLHAEMVGQYAGPKPQAPQHGGYPYGGYGAGYGAGYPLPPTGVPQQQPQAQPGPFMQQPPPQSSASTAVSQHMVSSASHLEPPTHPVSTQAMVGKDSPAMPTSQAFSSTASTSAADDTTKYQGQHSQAGGPLTSSPMVSSAMYPAQYPGLPYTNPPSGHHHPPPPQSQHYPGMPQQQSHYFYSNQQQQQQQMMPPNPAVSAPEYPSYWPQPYPGQSPSSGVAATTTGALAPISNSTAATSRADTPSATNPSSDCSAAAHSSSSNSSGSSDPTSAVPAPGGSTNPTPAGLHQTPHKLPE